MRLGFSVRVLGAADLPSHDPRSHGDLGISMICLRDVFHYMRRKKLSMYRMHSGLAPVSSGEPTAAAQLARARHEISLCGEMARTWDLRLSFHPYSAVVLSTPNEELALRSCAILEAQAGLLEAMELGREAVVVLHVGGVYDGIEASLERFVRRVETLPAFVRGRLTLENDDRCYSYDKIRWVHERTGMPLVLDVLHHQVHNPEGVPLEEALTQALRTWPENVSPKIHYATPLAELKTLGNGRIKLPTWTEHGDFVDPFVFARFVREAQHAGAFDVMLEAKARDLAVLKLRDDLERYAPDVARRAR